MSRKVRKLLSETKHNGKTCYKINNTLLTVDSNSDYTISSNIEDNKLALQNLFFNSSDVIFYEFECFCGIKALIIYINGIVDTNILDRNVINPFILKTDKLDKSTDQNLVNIKTLFPVVAVKELNNMSSVRDEIVNANATIFIDGINIAFSISSKNWNKRSIIEPDSESVVRGPKEGFIEDIAVNRTLIRKIIKSNNLVFENFTIGKQTETCVSICYINGIVNKKVLEQVRIRLNKIDTDSILESGYLEQFIEDSPSAILTTIGNSQKPDVIAAKILEGRVAILCEGSPHVLTVPYLFIEGLQVSEDYYNRPFIATLLRTVRLLALIISMFSPAIYVSLSTYHQEMIPTVFLRTMAGASSFIPLPAFVEAMLMTLMFQFLRESGTRLPKPIGSAVSIVGALVLGDAAVNAGIISAPMIIVIGITAICSFIVPPYTEIMAYYRFALIILAGIMGLYGVIAGAYMILHQIAALKSFGVPYFEPFAHLNKEELKDTFIRFPLWSMKKRPKSISEDNITRQGNTRGD
jgi:spore germination protein KA